MDIGTIELALLNLTLLIKETIGTQRPPGWTLSRNRGRKNEAKSKQSEAGGKPETAEMAARRRGHEEVESAFEASRVPA